MTDTRAAAHFAQTYAQARQLFLDAARDAGLAVASDLHPLKGHEGEDLALDVVRDGPADAAALLLISSACHGVEGFCGSGVQVALLRSEPWRAQVRASGVAVLYLHGLNPHGFSWWRRTTHENVDLNRNFVDFSQPLAANPDYDELAQAVVPADWPPPAAAQQVLAYYAARHGERGLRSVISRGQHGHPDGLFFAGTAPTWSHLRLREALRRHGQGCSRLAWIDLHTGLGPSGVGEKIFADRDDAQSLARARAWWGDQVTSIYDGSSSSPLLTGLMWTSIFDECPQAQYTGIALEYGTEPVAKVMQALRADHWLHLHPEAAPEQARQIRQQMREVFYTDTPAWRAQIVEQAQLAFAQAVAGLRAH
jgi:hypothetical protein